MLNTYGLRAVNAATFNPVHHDGYLDMDTDNQQTITTLIRIHNLVLNILGYIPGVCIVSGVARMTTGLVAIGATALFILVKIATDRRINIIESLPLYNETISTAAAQVFRGYMEAFVPFGAVVNASLDIAATPYNYYVDKAYPPSPFVHPEPLYEIPFNVFHYV